MVKNGQMWSNYAILWPQKWISHIKSDQKWLTTKISDVFHRYLHLFDTLGFTCTTLHQLVWNDQYLVLKTRKNEGISKIIKPYRFSSVGQNVQNPLLHHKTDREGQQIGYYCIIVFDQRWKNDVFSTIWWKFTEWKVNALYIVSEESSEDHSWTTYWSPLEGTLWSKIHPKRPS